MDFFSFFFQATAEQIRLAQMIYDTNDADFENKIKQVTCFSFVFVFFKAWPHLEDSAEWCSHISTTSSTHESHGS